VNEPRFATPAATPAPDAAGLMTHHLRDWDWEALRANGKLHLFCYLRDGVVALAPFDFAD
jgi:hypothetical protein